MRKHTMHFLLMLAAIVLLGRWIAVPANADEAVPAAEEQTEIQNDTKNTGVIEPEIHWVTDLPGEDNDSLYTEYAIKELGIEDWGDEGILHEEAMNTHLTGINLKLYQILKGKFEKIAAGTLTSTNIDIPIKDLITKTSYTAADLGMSSLDDFGEAINRAEKKSGLSELDIGLTVNSLLADCPYDLYWFDKTMGYFTSGPSYSWDDTSIRFTDGISMGFYVAGDYAKDDYTVDSSKGTRVKTAVNKAKSIVSAHKAENDRAKLVSYRKEICNLTAYNYDAAYGNADFGDPWQLINVFDGNTSTNVVCEGYSKAFQYLCDLSSFKGDVKCICATGYMSTASGGGGHMWNIVTLGGVNYLVDVTNCDSGSIGAPDKLFLVTPSPTDGGTVDTYYLFLNGSIAYQYDYEIREVFTEKDLTLGTVRKSFSDVPDSHIYAKYIYEAVEKGFVAGFDDGTFRPDDPVTRAQVVLFLWRLAGKPAPKSTTLKFKDAAEINGMAPDYAKAILWGSEKGIVMGYTSGANAGYFKPKDKCTRGQIVTFIWRYKGKPGAKSGAKTFPDVPKTHVYYNAIMWASSYGITNGFNDGTFRPENTCTRGQCVTFLCRVK